MRVVKWARLQAHATCGLRLGAWYPVIELTAREARVRVHGRFVLVPRSLVELRAEPPQQWTVVSAGVDPTRPLAGLRDGYVVCPNCRHRETTPEPRVPTLRCTQCNAAFAIAWNELYLRTERSRGQRGVAAGSAPLSGRVPRPPATTLSSDKRMTRRRLHPDRRAHVECRTSERRVEPLVATFPERRGTAQRRTLSRRSGRDRRSGVERRRKAVSW